MTAIRLTRDAIEYVTGDVDERMAKASRFCAKWTVPFRKKYSVKDGELAGTG